MFRNSENIVLVPFQIEWLTYMNGSQGLNATFDAEIFSEWCCYDSHQRTNMFPSYLVSYICQCHVEWYDVFTKFLLYIDYKNGPGVAFSVRVNCWAKYYLASVLFLILKVRELTLQLIVVLTTTWYSPLVEIYCFDRYFCQQLP